MRAAAQIAAANLFPIFVPPVSDARRRRPQENNPTPSNRTSSIWLGVCHRLYGPPGPEGGERLACAGYFVGQGVAVEPQDEARVGVPSSLATA
jgi:hypothetical protein